MIEGYCVVYEALAAGVRGPCTAEEFAPGAFDASIRRQRKPIKCTLNHKRTIATTADGRLRLFSDDVGVRFELRGFKLPADFTGCSFRFRNARVEGSGVLCRVIEAELTEVSILYGDTLPAYPITKSLTREV